jgi:endo-1,3-1,4-beta-glycanase ExoK
VCRFDLKVDLERTSPPFWVVTAADLPGKIVAFPKKREVPPRAVAKLRSLFPIKPTAPSMKRTILKLLGFMTVTACPQLALAVSSAELYTVQSYGYGRFEARVRYAPGDGVVSSFFLWKDGSEQAGTFWNELDFEKLGADCRMETNPIYGKPAANHSQKHALALDMCGAFQTYAYEWTPEAIVWFINGQEIRREVGAAAQAFVDNAPGGMQIHFNLWPGDATFGGNFDPAILPVHEYIDWVQYSKWEAGAFTLAWREDFDGATVPDGWGTGTWESPKKKSTHAEENVNFIDGYAVLSLTADDKLGPAGAKPGDAASGSAGSGGAPSGSAGTGGVLGVAGSPSAGGTTSAGGAPTSAGGTAPAPGGGVPAPVTVNNSAPTDGGCAVRPGLVSSAYWLLGALAFVLGARRIRRGSAPT